MISLNKVVNLIERLPILGPVLNRLTQGILNILLRTPIINKWVNQKAVNYIASCTYARPRPYSLWSQGDNPLSVVDYTSWPSLTDKTFSGRHLGPVDYNWVATLPPVSPIDHTFRTNNLVTSLFRRQGAIITDRSSVLFMFFAQWFTDSILRTDPKDRRKNTSRHDVNLCQIYGLDEDKTLLLRSLKDGRLRSQIINGEEYLDYLCESDGENGWKVKKQYENLGYTNQLDLLVEYNPERIGKLYATGLERGNSTIGYVAISTLFMREHNRICGELEQRNPNWGDEQLFQTARMINIILLLKLVVEEYINHIAGMKLFRLDVGFAEKQDWYRTNWIAIEFNLLYRWHSLVPDVMTINGTSCKADDFRCNNALYESIGLGEIISSASSQAAGKIGLRNTPDFLLDAEYSSIKMGRDYRLRSYNDYREHFGYTGCVASMN